jgi:hypothetical protein
MLDHNLIKQDLEKLRQRLLNWKGELRADATSKGCCVELEEAARRLEKAIGHL